MKNTAQWFYEQVYSEESIAPRAVAPKEQLPSLLRTARSLEQGWQSRESIFLKQAKLLAAYEDDYPFSGSITRYYPTYQSLTDQELRGYFSWRTKLRQGDIQKAPLTFAFLYIYELLNQVGVSSPLDGFQKLSAFWDSYGAMDSGIRRYLKYWLRDYVVYYNLEPGLLSGSPQSDVEQSVSVLENIPQESEDAIMAALGKLGLKWLNRSKFYQTHTQDMNHVIAGALRAIAAHCSTRCKKGFVEQYVGCQQKDLDWLFSSAVFCDPLKRKNYAYKLSSRCTYHCRNGQWMVEQFYVNPQRCAKLDDILKAIDREMRLVFDPKHPIKSQLDTKWILKIIREEVQSLQAQKQAVEAKKITIDRSRLARIRQDAAITQEKLIVDEEPEEAPPPPEPVQQEEAPAEEPDTPLTPTEYRFLQCLLYGKDRSWVRAEGIMLSVLLDSINEKLYDSFQDSVLLDDGQIIEDYIDDLKEMVKP